jgi:hypothetical protein
MAPAMAMNPPFRSKTRQRAWSRLVAAGAFALCVATSAQAQTEIEAPAKLRLAQSFFDRLFNPFPRGGLFPAPRPEPQRPADSSRAPAPRKPDTPPTATIMVLGDSLADWLAYGLEEALVDTPEIGVVRKARAGSGLIRYDLRNDSQDWPQAIRDILATEKPNYLVMMIGLHDRQAIRVRQGQARPPAPSGEKARDQEQETDNAEREADAQRQRTPGIYEFQSERWEELYTRRIDDVIAVLKSRGVPVFWVGLPPLRGQKAATDAAYLNDLFRAQAEKAGIVYVDIWDGFVDEQGRFTLQGPDFEGQNRRLRTGDGIHFTKAGARKLAHYLEREINRVAPLQAMAVAVPEPQPQTPSPRPGGPTARPLNGPAVPLALFARPDEELAGGAPSRGAEWATQMANHVLVKGEPIAAPAGRADDFVWPRRGIAPFNSDPAVTTTTMPVPLAQLPPPPPKAEPPAKTAAARAPTAQQFAQPPSQLRPLPQPQRPAFNPFSFFGSLFR